MLKNSNRENNYGLLRFLLATAIMLTHSYDLWQTPDLKVINTIFVFRFAVDAFFVISGFFIFNSYERSKSLKNFFVKRALRIYPAYAPALFAFVFLAILLTRGELLKNPMLLVKYYGVNFLGLNFFQPTLPGVFEGNHHPDINGALWTLKIEFMFYASVPVIIWFSRKWNKSKLFISLYFLSIVYYMGFRYLHLESDNPFYAALARQFPGKLCLFVAGGFLFHYLNTFKKHGHLYFALSVAGMLLWWYGEAQPLYPICLAVLVVYLGSCVPYLGNIRKIADFSVGIFLYHFPVMQTLIASGLFVSNPVLGVFSGMAIVYALAFLSWHYIEKPFLNS